MTILAASLDEEMKKISRKAGIDLDALKAEKAKFERLVQEGTRVLPSAVNGNLPPASSNPASSNPASSNPVKHKKAQTPKPRKPASQATTKTTKKPNAKKVKAKSPHSGNGGIAAPVAAKVRYKAYGDVDNCGDWLAKTLKDAFLSKEGFNLDAFTTCCKENGLDTKAKWASNRAPGWQGRFRMNGRQMLELVLAEEGFIKIDGKKIEPTGVFLKAMQKKHSAEEE